MPTFSTCARCSRLLDEANDAPVSARHPCPVCGSLRRTSTTSLVGTTRDLGLFEGQRPVAGEVVEADASDAATLLRSLFRATFQWFELPDGRWHVRALNGNGAILDGGLADTPERALDEVVRRLLPPASAA